MAWGLTEGDEVEGKTLVVAYIYINPWCANVPDGQLPKLGR